MPAAFVDDPDFCLYVGDVRDVLAELDPVSVDCVVTSPPYWGLRDYAVEGQIGLEPDPEAYVAELVAVFRGARRVLADHGTVWLNLGDSYNSRLDGSHGGWNGSSPEPQVVDDRGPTNAWTGQLPRLAQKTLLGMPWRVAFALQQDGWILRCDIVWSKPNPMPESVTDRPTKSHEYVFLLSKRPRYFFDQEAIREKATYERWGAQTQKKSYDGVGKAAMVAWRSKNEIAERFDTSSRNVRSVWEIAAQPYPGHFATYPEELVRRCLLAGCPERVCRVCGKPSERLTEASGGLWEQRKANGEPGRIGMDNLPSRSGERGSSLITTVGWSDCGHNHWRPGTVLDPFMGSGTTALVARKHGRHAVGIELSPVYAELCARRLSQLSLFAEGAT